MTNDPNDPLTVADPSLFLGEAVGRLRTAARLIDDAIETPDDWDGDSGWAVEAGLEMIRDVAKAIEAYEAAVDANDKAKLHAAETGGVR